MPHTDTHTRSLKAAALWVLVALWCVFIFFASAHTGSDLNTGTDLLSRIRQALDTWQEATFGPGVDVISNIAHFMEYLILGALLFAALSQHLSRRRTVLIAAIALASLYGLTDEFHQLFVEGRACDPLDWLTDTLGASLGALIAFWFAVRLSKKTP